MNFEFEFTYLKGDNYFTIEPLKGIIPGKGKIDI